MYANLPAVNSLKSIYMFLERPVVQAELNALNRLVSMSPSPNILSQSMLDSMLGILVNLPTFVKSRIFYFLLQLVQLGEDVFPLVPQNYFATYRDMFYGLSFPAVAKLGHAHAGTSACQRNLTDGNFLILI
jgi:hypothetical protein